MFTFRYQNILKYKEDLEQQAKNDLARAVAALNDAKQRLTDLESQLKSYKCDCLQSLEAGVTASSFSFNDVHRRYFEDGIKTCRSDIALAKQNIAICRQHLMTCTQDKKKYEKLKEKEKAAYQEEERKREEQLIDQLVNYRSSFRNTEGTF